MKQVAAKRGISRNPLVASLEKDSNYTLTENGALTHASSLDSVVDFFGMGGALRQRQESEVIQLFGKAVSEDPLLAMKCLFHTRNCRGGVGERNTFRIILKYLANTYPNYVRKNIANVVQFGRFDDLLVLFGTRVEKEAVQFYAEQLYKDQAAFEAGQSISLAAKWAPSENASSKETRRLGTKLRVAMGMTERNYRKSLSALRKYSNVIETAISAKDWKNIDYSKVPSKAGLIYRKAFARHDEDGYSNFLERVNKGEAKINASTLFPYEIADKVLFKGEKGETVKALWNALPDYLNGVERNILVVADVSDSMTWGTTVPMSTAVSLALYTAERNSGDFHNFFITFSDNPSFQKVQGANVVEKLNNIRRAPWGGSTNLQGVFDLVLKHAVSNRVPSGSMPSQIIIVSDMEFNSACRGTNLDTIKAKYKAAGYPVPQLVFWNANSRNNNVAATADEKGVVLVSGCSPAVFKTLLSGKNVTPTDQMLETLLSPMYDSVVI